MFDIGLSSAGSSISLASSSDPSYPPDNILDGKPETFWLTTGMFPQEFIVTFASVMNVNNVKITCHNVRRLSLEKSVQGTPIDFEPVREATLDGSDGELQTHEFTLGDISAQHMRFKVDSGYNHFVSIHELHIDGNAMRI